MKEKRKNKSIGKTIATSMSINNNNNISLLLTNTNQTNNSKNIKSPSINLSSKGTIGNFPKRAHSLFKFKKISENSQNNSNKINLNTIITSINNYTSFSSNDKTKKMNKVNNNKNYSNNNTIKYHQCLTTDSNKTYNISEYRSLSPRISKWKKLLPKKTSNKKTLVLDLDETLVHSGFIPFNCPSDLVIKIEQDNDFHDIHVLVRPHVEVFLEKMSKKFELVIFTASISNYANPLLNLIDKMGYVPFRLFREHCTLINTAFVKDLTRLGRDLKDIIILDNNPLAYSLNQYNGFPIKSWFDDKNDDELLKIIPILEFLSYVPDVREYIKKIVVQNKIQFDLVKNVISNYNNELKKKMISFDYEDTLKSFNNDLFLHKSKSTKINLLKKKYNNYRGNKNKNLYINKKRNNNHEYTQLTSLFNCLNILNTNANNKTKTDINSNINLITNTYSLSKGNTKRCIKKNEMNLNKLIKRKKLINLNTVRYNLSTKKIPFNKINNSSNKDSTLNLNNLNNINMSHSINNNTAISNNNYYKKNKNNQLFFRPNKNYFYISNIKTNTINKKITNNSFVTNKIIYNQTISKENNINYINSVNTNVNKSLKIKKKESSKKNCLNRVMYNIGYLDKNKEKKYFFKINGNYPKDNTKNNNRKTNEKKEEEKLIRTIFRNNNIILNNSQKIVKEIVNN
jgi:RNA polymerase II subunit A small phosphatase-like protein